MVMNQGTACAGVSSLLKEVGRTVALMHDGGLVHGDLTTSNLLVRKSDGAVVSSAHQPVTKKCSCNHATCMAHMSCCGT